MRFERVALAGLGYDLPSEVVTSLEIEERLAPLYDRLGLIPGRLELMTGIRERRFWPHPVRPSDVASKAGARALGAAGVARDRIGVLIHASVCRDFLEPATASVVHHALELSPGARFFDLSNACLGVLSAIELIAPWVEQGALDAALIVAGEDGRPLVENTIRALNEDPLLDRRAIKGAFASLTIGSAAAAVVIARAELAPQAPKIRGITTRVASEHHRLCQGEAGGGMAMTTDAEALLHAGLALARETFAGFAEDLGWSPASIQRSVTHQVGRAHTLALYQALGIAESTGYLTYDRLGNVGSAAVPISLALAAEADFIRRGERVGLLGIGSGLASTMIGIEW